MVERSAVRYGLLGVDQKITDTLTKIMILEKVEIAVRSGTESRFVIMGFGTSDTILGLCFFSLTVYF